MIYGIGTDIFLMLRIAKQSISGKDPFVLRAYTENERLEAQKHVSQDIFYATRFSAKEAVYKSIGQIGIEFKPGEIEILEDSNGCPHVFLRGTTQKILSEKINGTYSIFLSISYDTDYCTAFAVTEIN